MKFVREFLANALVGGLLIVLPIYLAVLVLLKGMQSVAALVRPLTMLLPAWLPAENLLSLALVLVVCFLIGIAVRTRVGRILRERMERSLFERLQATRSFAASLQRLAGEGREAPGSRHSSRSRGARPGLHHRRARGRPLHHLRPIGPDALRRSRLYPQSRTCACARRSVHAGDQLHLALGIRLEGPGGSDDENGAVSGPPPRPLEGVNGVRRCRTSASFWRRMGFARCHAGTSSTASSSTSTARNIASTGSRRNRPPAS